MIRHRAPVALLAALAAASSGCGGGLMQEQQAVVIKFDPDSSGLTFLFVYQGLHVDNTGAGKDAMARELATAKQQLADFVASGQKFGGFLFGRIDNLEFGPVPQDDPATAADRAKFAAVTRVRNNAFFLDPKGGLCVSQTITLFDPDSFARSCNPLISRGFDHEMTRQLTEPESPENNPKLSRSARKSLQAAAKAGHDWLRITPGRVALNFPVTPEDAAMFLVQLESMPKEKSVIPALREAIEGFEIKAGPDGLTLSMGDGKKRTIAIRPGAEPSDQPRRDAELIAFARTLKLPFEPTMDVERLIREFSAK